METYNELAEKLLAILCENARLAYQEELGEFSHGELSILKHLRDERSGLTSGELAEALSMTLPRMSAALSSLVKKDYISKAADIDDKRKTRIHITPAGLDHVTEKESILREKVLFILSALGENDAREYVRISERIKSIRLI